MRFVERANVRFARRGDVHDSPTPEEMSMIWVLVAAVVVLLIVIGVLVQRHERSRRLQAGFGPEYQRVIEDRGDRRAAERELSDRQERHETFELRELSPRLAPTTRVAGRRLSGTSSTSRNERSGKPTRWSVRSCMTVATRSMTTLSGVPPTYRSTIPSSSKTTGGSCHLRAGEPRRCAHRAAAPIDGPLPSSVRRPARLIR